VTDPWADPDFVLDDLEAEGRRPVTSRNSVSIWIAEGDGIAHARAHRISTRTACGIAAIDERYAWPAIAKCALCAAVLKRAGL
jgi:hypothetical protein